MTLTSQAQTLTRSLGETSGRWLAPFQKTEPQREAMRMLGRAGLGTLGVGSTAALLMMLRRHHERELLDEDKAKALLPVPIYVRDNEKHKSASAATKGIAAGLGTLGLAGTVAGLAYGNHGENGVDSANPASRLFNTATGLIPGGRALRDEQDRYADLPGTIRGEHAKSFADVPWFAPGVLGVSLLGLGAGYAGVNAIGNALARRKLKKRRQQAIRVYDEALRNEQTSKLGAALEAFVTACEELAPSVKEASVLEWYLALLGTAGVAGGMAGTYHGYQGADQKFRLAALKSLRKAQLAKRRNTELSLVPRIHHLPSPSSDANVSKDPDEPVEKTADLVRQLGGLLWQGGTSLLKGTARRIPGAVRTTAKVPKYLAKQQPLTTLTAAGLLGTEGLGRLADHYHSPWGQYKPSTWVFNRFAENQPLNDSQGNPVWGTRRLYSADPNDFPDMRWSWNPLSERGFGWRFRKEPNPQRVILAPEARPTVSELTKASNPSVAMRRRMNEQFYDYSSK